MSKKYIHYGHKKFDSNLFCPIKNRRCFTKPHGGLWASPVAAKFGWKNWNDGEHFCECREENSFIFTLRENAQVITIRSVEEAKRLPQNHDPEFDFDLWVTPDFEKLVESGYDAIELVLSADWELYLALYGWDCDSILILNPEVVVCV